MMCCTVACPVPVLGPEAGRSTVVTLELDITAAAAAPLGKWEVKVCWGAAEGPMCRGGPGVLLRMMDICMLAAIM